MRRVIRFYKRRGLPVTLAGFLIVLPVWMVLRLISEIDNQPRLIADPPSPFHSNSRLLPFRYWYHRAVYPDRYTDHSCMKFPAISDLQYAASFWQVLRVENGSVYVYGAYYDDRFQEPLVRILIYTDVAPVPKLFCQLWFPDVNEPQTELAEPMYAWHSQRGSLTGGINEPYVLACKCRRNPSDIAPVAAAVVSAPCGVATNVLDIQQAPFNDPLMSELAAPSRRHGTSVAVCLKWLHYRQDVSVQVIEWLQLMKHFGAEKVYIYIIRVHPKTREVLKYFEDQGFVVVTELSHPPQVSGFHQDAASRDFRDNRRELLPLNDCLYRSIGRHDWIASLDLDQIIVPPPGSTWPDMIDNEKATAAAEPSGKPFDSLVFPNYYVLDDAQKDIVAPAKTRILAHTWRSRKQSSLNPDVESFFNVSSVTTMHNHKPLSCNGVLGSCTKRNMNGPGRMLHYRPNCEFERKVCQELHDVVREDVLDGWRRPVLKEVEEVLEELKLEGL